MPSEPVLIALIAAAVAIFGSFIAQIPAILLAVRSLREMTALKIHVNSNTDKLVQAAKELATSTGRAEGKAEAEAQGTVKADAVAIEVARAVTVARERESPDRGPSPHDRKGDGE